jgi:hypothetical protein
MPTKPIPEGFHSLTSYLFAEGAARLIDFIFAAFEGETGAAGKPAKLALTATMRKLLIALNSALKPDLSYA